MNKPETQVTLDTRHRTKKNKTRSTTQKTKIVSNTDPTKTAVNSGFAKSAVLVSYNSYSYGYQLSIHSSLKVQ